MIRLHYRIEEGARCVPVLGLVVALLVVIVFLVIALDLHEECPLELIAVGCLALVAAGTWLASRRAQQTRSMRKTWLPGTARGRAPPVVSASLVFGSFVSGASPSLR